MSDSDVAAFHNRDFIPGVRLLTRRSVYLGCLFHGATAILAVLFHVFHASFHNRDFIPGVRLLTRRSVYLGCLFHGATAILAVLFHVFHASFSTSRVRRPTISILPLPGTFAHLIG